METFPECYPVMLIVAGGPAVEDIEIVGRDIEALPIPGQS
jgi:hypothetical protein